MPHEWTKESPLSRAWSTVSALTGAWLAEAAQAGAWLAEFGFDIWNSTGDDDLKWEEDESVWE